MLYTSLGFEDLEFPAGLGWSDKLNEGLSVKALNSLASFLEVTPLDLAHLIGFPPENLKNKKNKLTAYQADYLFKIALTYNRLKPVLKDHAEVLGWMKTSRKEVRNQIPVLLLATEPGSFLVFECISNMKPKQEKVSDVKEKDYEDDDDLELDSDSPLNNSIKRDGLDDDDGFEGASLGDEDLTDLYN